MLPPKDKYSLLLWLGAAIAVFWLLYHGTSEDNALRLASAGGIDLHTVWAYRFRSAAEFHATGGTQILLKPFIIGAPLLFVVMLVFNAVLLAYRRTWIKIFGAVVLPLLAYFAPAAISWSTCLVAVAAAIQLRRQWFAAIFFVLCAAWCAALGSVIANPFDMIHRQRVLGGISYRDLFAVSGGEKIDIRENCLAAINPHDLRAISSLERIRYASLTALSGIALVDLKAVEENYRLLSIRGKNGDFVFSDEARLYAEAEKRYAAVKLLGLLNAERLCLIANFDVHPDQEVIPFTRARQISDARRKFGRETVIIHLAAR